MAKGTKEYKRDPDPNLECVNNLPKHSAACTAVRTWAGAPELLRRLNQVRLLLPKGSLSPAKADRLQRPSRVSRVQ